MEVDRRGQPPQTSRLLTSKPNAEFPTFLQEMMIADVADGIGRAARSVKSRLRASLVVIRSVINICHTATSSRHSTTARARPTGEGAKNLASQTNRREEERGKWGEK